jgi:lipoprotein-anchoring transpeptidase ErfK/SrfK
VVNTFNVVTGKNGDRESDPGTFFVNIKYETQDMRGADYLSKGVKWISYYNGGEGFHAAPWNVTGIAKGDPVNYGSHGCINMTPSDAQWIYENAPGRHHGQGHRSPAYCRCALTAFICSLVPVFWWA